MAVPKKKTSHLKVRNRYTLNNIKKFKYRILHYKFLDLKQLILRKELWMPFNFLNNKKKKYKINKNYKKNKKI